MSSPSARRAIEIVCAAVAGAAVLLATRDAARGFPGMSGGAVLGLCAAFLVAAALLARRSRAIGLALAACALLCANAALQHHRQRALDTLSHDQIGDDLDQRATHVAREFEDLLARLASPLELMRADLGQRGMTDERAAQIVESVAAAARLERRGIGLTLYGPGGRALAWTGPSYPPPPGLLQNLPEARLIHRAVMELEMTRVVGLLTLGPFVAVTEAPVASNIDSTMGALALPWLSRHREIGLQLQDFREEAVGMADLLDRSSGRYRPDRGGDMRYLYLRLPERARGGYLGLARLQGSARGEMQRRIIRQHQIAALAAAFLLLGALALLWPRARGGAISPLAARCSRLGALIALVWSVRALLLWFDGTLGLPRLAMFDSSVFASERFFHLIRSPGDLLMTALALLATSLLVAGICGAIVASADRPIRRRALRTAAGAAGLVLLAAAGLRLLPALAGALVNNSSVNLMQVALGDPLSSATLLQTGLLLVLVAVAIAAAALAALALSGGGPSSLRLVPAPGDSMSRWVFGLLVPGMLAACLAFGPLLSRPGQRAMESLYEDLWMPEVLQQQERRQSIVRATIDYILSHEDLAERVRDVPERDRDTLALDIWKGSPLAASGYNASLVVRDSAGVTLSRFSRNLPPTFDEHSPDAGGGGGTIDEPILESLSVLGLRRQVLHDGCALIAGGIVVGEVTVHVLNELDNIPFLIPRPPYARALAPQARQLSSLLASDRAARHCVYDRSGALRYTNRREAPRPPRPWDEAGPRWTDVIEEARPARYLFFSDDSLIYGLGFGRATLLERLARVVRIGFIAAGALLALLLPAALLSLPRNIRRIGSRLLASLGRTHYRKLLIAFAGASTIPLVVLALLILGFVQREIDRDVEERGRHRAESARRLLQAVLEQDPATGLDDDLIFFISSLVGEDVNLYQSDRLVATSRREWFGAGLLPQRMDGAVHRALVVEGRPFATGSESLSGMEYRTVTVPVEQGFLSLPLDSQRDEASRRAHEVQDALLLTVGLMAVLMGAIGYVLARRVSSPIRSLSQAAIRITGGDLDATVEAHPRDETGELIAAFNAMAAALKEQRQDLENRKDYIEKVLQNAAIGVVSTDRHGIVVTANPAAARLLALPNLRPGDTLPALLEDRPALRPLAAALAAPASADSRDLDFVLPEGAAAQERNLRARLVIFLEGEGILLLLQDVTEAVRSNRLAAWAEMARRIAHEIKNPLTPIQLSAEHIRRVHAEGSKNFPNVLEECLRTIMEQVAELRRISQEFFIYARIPAPRREPTPMSEFLEETLRPYRVAPPPRLELVTHIPERLPVLMVDRSLIGRALVNLLENALQAMSREGVLKVSASVSNGQLAVDVADTGHGMTPEEMSRIFEPYFSTKDSGTGLGLAIARKAVEEHGGSIEVFSTPGVGTRMRVTLPTSEGADAVLEHHS